MGDPLPGTFSVSARIGQNYCGGRLRVSATPLPFERDTIGAALEAAGYEVREVVTRFDVGNTAATSPRISARWRDIS